MEEQNVAVRLKHFIDYLAVTNSQFADACGIPRPSLSQLLSGRNKKLSDVVVKQIHDRYPQLSVLWLMFGEGEMLVPEPLNPALASEAAKFMDDEPNSESGENLSALNPFTQTFNNTENQSVNPKIELNANPRQIAKNALPPRKVISITVFYDDNSYETFIPDKN